MVRRVLQLLIVFVSACGIDPSLTCGSTCTDASSPQDGTVGVDASDAGQDAFQASDGNNNQDSSDGSMCKGNGGFCMHGSDCCSMNCANQQCVMSCPSTCTGGGGQCCTQQYCQVDAGQCMMCKDQGTSCTNDYECCNGGNCVSFDGGPLHCSGGGG